jgi:multiple sugar transport system permease protein
METYIQQTQQPKSLLLRRGLIICLRYLLMIFVFLFFAIPFVWMFTSALRPVQEIFKYIQPLSWKTLIPVEFTTNNLTKLLFSEGSLWPRYIINSLLVSISIVVLGGLINAMAAYGFTFFRFPGREILFLITLTTIIIPFETIALPLYLIVKHLDWIDKFQALIVPVLANAFIIFLLRQFFMDIPRELIEAAIIDGASHPRIFFTIIIPLSRPVLITISLMMFQASWDAFIWPLMVTNSPDVRLIQLGLSTLIGQYHIYWDYLFAAVALTAVVPMVIFVILQRYYVQGISRTGLHG